VQAQIDTVKDVMIENIDRVLERGERIELLVDKTDRLNQQAFKFEKTVGERCLCSNGVLSCESGDSADHSDAGASSVCCSQSRTLKNTMYYRKIRNIVILVVFVAVSAPSCGFFLAVNRCARTLVRILLI
jgi:hypothetical protein